MLYSRRFTVAPDSSQRIQVHCPLNAPAKLIHRTHDTSCIAFGIQFSWPCSFNAQVSDVKAAIETSQGAGYPASGQVIIFQGKVSSHQGIWRSCAAAFDATTMSLRNARYL